MLEKIFTTTVLAISMVMFGFNIYDRLQPKAAAAQTVEGQVRNLKGKHFAFPEGFSTTKSATLVMVVSTQCTFCTRSMPFYQEIAKLQAANPEFATVAILPQDRSSGTAYLAEHGVAVDYVGSSPLTGLSITGTPTLLLLDRSGTIRMAWIGMLDDSGRRDVLAKLKSPLPLG